MKNFIYLSIISILFISCGDDSDSEDKNAAPTVPVITSPVDNELCVNNAVDFEWEESTDKNNDDITYLIEIAKDNQFTQIVTIEEGAFNSLNGELEKNTAYYWRIKAKDSQGLSSDYTSVYKFYTAGEAVVNHLPFSPELLTPTLNSVLTTTDYTLKWNATDADSDILSYDVYLGTVNPPTSAITTNTSATSLNVKLESAKEYYWKVVAKDNKGGETIGQVWKFKTN